MKQTNLERATFRRKWHPSNTYAFRCALIRAAAYRDQLLEPPLGTLRYGNTPMYCSACAALL